MAVEEKEDEEWQNRKNVDEGARLQMKKMLKTKKKKEKRQQQAIEADDEDDGDDGDDGEDVVEEEKSSGRRRC